MNFFTEDEVRAVAQNKLNINNSASGNFYSGTGQITSFKTLGINSNKKPDGWVLYPKNKNASAIILECKASDKDLNDPKTEDEIKRNCEIAFFNEEFDCFDASFISVPVYKYVLGILYNGVETRYFLFYRNNKGIIVLGEEQNDYPRSLQSAEYYIGDGYDGGKIHAIPINKQEIYAATKAINETLHFKFNIKNLYHRMIFTACTLVVVGNDDTALDGAKSFNNIKAMTKDALENFESANPIKHQKITDMLKIFDTIEANVSSVDIEFINNFIEKVKYIAQNINTHQWNGEDVMGIFFNEFNRYKAKSDNGQVFTPEHIVSLICKLINISDKDHVLDAACGSGAFLTKAMCMMVNENGGDKAAGVEDIKSNNLYGVEFDKEIYALACANMLIHKDGKTNLLLGDSTSEYVGEWIRQQDITKVVMNPPYENKYGCMKIVANVLNNVPAGTPCAFILPDKKLEKCQGDTKKILKEHSLEKIIKLPENTFDAGITTSIFIFTAHKPMDFDEEIFTCYIEDDGLERVKNQGRQDTKERWPALELEWIKIINKTHQHETGKWMKPDMQHLSYQMPQQEVELYEEDFIKTLVDFQLFLEGTDVKKLKENLANTVLYSSHGKEIFKDVEN